MLLIELSWMVCAVLGLGWGLFPAGDPRWSRWWAEAMIAVTVYAGGANLLFRMDLRGYLLGAALAVGGRLALEAGWRSSAKQHFPSPDVCLGCALGAFATGGGLALQLPGAAGVGTALLGAWIGLYFAAAAAQQTDALTAARAALVQARTLLTARDP